MRRAPIAIIMFIWIPLVLVGAVAGYAGMPPIGHVSPTALNHSVAGEVGYGMGVSVHGVKGCTKLESARWRCTVNERSEGNDGTYLVTMRGRRCWTAQLRTGGDQHLSDRASGCVRFSDQVRPLSRLHAD